MTMVLPMALGLLLQSTVLLLLGLVAMRSVRRHGPAVQSLIGRATLAGVGVSLLLIGPLAGHVRPVWRVRVGAHLPAPSAPPPSVAAPSPYTPPELGAGGRAVPLPELSPASATSRAVPLLPNRSAHAAWPSLRLLLSATWASGTALLLLWLAACQWHLTRLRRRACPITSGPAAETLMALTPHPPALLVHLSVRSPFLAGLWHPAIFLPTTYETDFDPAASRAILAHELAHLARQDNAWTLAARLLSALLWPQPLLWVLCRRLEQSGEEACDLAVLAQDCPPRAYADCLLTLAERYPLGRRERALGAGVAPFRSSLGQRIGRILDKGTHAMSTVTTRLRLTVATLAVAAALGGAFLVSSAPAQSPTPATVTLTPEKERYNAMRMQDMANLKAIGIALTQYVQDNDEFYPRAAHWMDALSPYLKDKTVLFDPSQPGAQRYGYALNRTCSGKSLAAFAHPSETIAVFDSTLAMRNASDTGQSLRATGAGDMSGSNCLFVDGHVKWNHAADQPSFAVKWDPRWHDTPPPGYYSRKNVTHSSRPTLARILAWRNRVSSSVVQNDALGQARFLAGLTPVQGPGVAVTLNDSKKTFPRILPPGMTPPNLIHDTDINAVVNELKAAGADAISVNGQRLVATSSIRSVGPAVLVNSVPQAPPFIIKAIGDPKTLASAMTLPGGVATQLKAYDSAMFSVEKAGTLTLPAYSGGGTPRYAKPVLRATPRSTGDSETMQGTGTGSPIIPVTGKAQRVVGYGLKMVLAERPYCAAVKGSEAARVGIPSNTFDEVIAVNDQAASPSGPHTLALLQAPPPLHLMLRGPDNRVRSFTLSSKALLSVPPLVAVQGWETKDLAVKRAGLAAARRDLLGVKQQTEKAVREMLPLADAATLTAAISVEKRYGEATTILKFATKYKNLCREQRDAAGYARAVQRQSEAREQMKQSLSEEARMFPATSPARDHLAQTHALAVRLAETHADVNVREGIVSLTLSVMQQQTGPTL